MSTPRRVALLLAGLMTVLSFAAGCNVIGTAMYVFGPEPKRDPELVRLASDDKKKEVKVVMIASSGMETGPDFMRVDRELSNYLAKALDDGFKVNEEKVTIVPTRQVERFKDETPNWQTLDLQEIGKKFKADYVISLEINSLSVFEKGSANQLYRGNADISIKVADLNKPEDYPICKEFRDQFPSEMKGPIPVGDSSPQQFKQTFLAHIALKLSWYFTAHTIEKEKFVD